MATAEEFLACHARLERDGPHSCRGIHEDVLPNVARLWPHLVDRFHHSTTARGFLGILRDRQILPSGAGQPQAWPQTEGSYARRFKSVALFDFYSPTLKQVIQTGDRWTTVLFHWPLSVLFTFEPPRVPTVVTYPDRLQSDLFYIPYTEAWHPGPLHVERATSATLVVGYPRPHNLVLFQPFPVSATGLQELARTLAVVNADVSARLKADRRRQERRARRQAPLTLADLIR